MKYNLISPRLQKSSIRGFPFWWCHQSGIQNLAITSKAVDRHYSSYFVELHGLGMVQNGLVRLIGLKPRGTYTCMMWLTFVNSCRIRTHQQVVTSASIVSTGAIPSFCSTTLYTSTLTPPLSILDSDFIRSGSILKLQSEGLLELLLELWIKDVEV